MELDTTLISTIPMPKVVQTLTGTASAPCVLPALLTMTGSFGLKIPVWKWILLHSSKQLEWLQGMLVFAATSTVHLRLPGGMVARHREGVPSQDYRHLWIHVPCHLLTDIHTIFAADFLLFGYSALEYLKAAGSNCSFR